jgi:protein-S-isoprenylcysteine O-methyltransferase Ste14
MTAAGWFVPLSFPAMWLMWALYWRIESRGVKANVWAESLPSRLMHVVPMVIAALLLVLNVHVLGLDERFLPASPAVVGTGFVLTAAGLLFTVWARRHLAANWSADVTIKADHELIITGPYAWARHPIYTGLLLGIIGSALAVGRWRGIVSVVLVAMALGRKLRIEERGMRQLFGDRYREYESHVAALIPFVF